LAKKVTAGRKAMMRLPIDQNGPSVEALIAVVARSPIVVPRPAASLPAGYDDVDLAILNWIAAEARQLRSFTLM
jgi:hypothetical protein